MSKWGYNPATFEAIGSVVSALGVVGSGFATLLSSGGA
jgi:hypothetical protein